MYIDFFLFLTILALCLLNANISYFAGPLLKWLNKASSQEKNLLEQKLKLRKEQTQISMVDNFAKHAKIQRKINGIDEELSQLKSDRQANHLFTRLFLQYGMKVPISALLFLIVILCRSSPVLVLNKEYDLFPFSVLISYPLEDVNGVSVHMWALCCSSV
ncbi:hypothetical protein AMK59_4156, partial [Oryctes borbonicus]